MEREKINFTNIDEYILTFPNEIQEKLTALRERIRAVVPDAEEKISWGMPTFWLQGNLIHFAAFKNHIGIYPGERGVSEFQDKLTEYKSSKGTIQFPFNKPLPLDLVEEIVKFRVKENLELALNKKKK